MSTTEAVPATTPATVDPLRGRALAAGLLYLLTFVSIPTLALYAPAWDTAAFVLGAGSTTGVLLGTLAEVVVALACIGTAVVLYPVARRQSETAAIGFVSARVLEGTLILVGVVSILTLVSLRGVTGTAGADTASLVTAGHVQVATYDWTFLLSQSLAPVFNALCLGWVLYRSGLVPRVLPALGLLGAPVLLASDLAVLFGVYERTAPYAALAALPIAVWELSLGIYLTVKGFRPPAVAALAPTAARAGR